MHDTAVNDHEAPMLEVIPVMPSAEIIMLFRGCVRVTVSSTTAVVDDVESNTKLQLLAYSGDDVTCSVLLAMVMPPVEVKAESSKLADHPPAAPVMVVEPIDTTAASCKKLPTIQKPTYL